MEQSVPAQTANLVRTKKVKAVFLTAGQQESSPQEDRNADQIKQAFSRLTVREDGQLVVSADSQNTVLQFDYQTDARLHVLVLVNQEKLNKAEDTAGQKGEDENEPESTAKESEEETKSKEAEQDAGTEGAAEGTENKTESTAIGEDVDREEPEPEEISETEAEEFFEAESLEEYAQVNAAVNYTSLQAIQIGKTVELRYSDNWNPSGVRVLLKFEPEATHDYFIDIKDLYWVAGNYYSVEILDENQEPLDQYPKIEKTGDAVNYTARFEGGKTYYIYLDHPYYYRNSGLYRGVTISYINHEYDETTGQCKYCGLQKTWTYENGKLSILDDSAMDFVKPAPWDYAKTGIEEIEFASGVTQIKNEVSTASSGALKTITIPETVTSIAQNSFYGLFSISSINWNAKDAGFGSQTISTYGSPYIRLELGNSVDVISADTLSNLCNFGVRTIHLRGENQIHLPGLSSTEFPQPYRSLEEGDYYVDANGVIYRLYDDHAEVAVCQEDEHTELTIPATVPYINNGGQSSVPVTKVRKNAFKLAKSLRALTFEDPAALKEISDYAFADANNLETINGKEKSSEINALLSSASIGVLPYYETKIKQDADAEARKSDGDVVISRGQAREGILKVTLHPVSRDENYQYNGPEDSQGDPLAFWTGETAHTDITISNPDSSDFPEGTVIRIFVRFQDDGGVRTNYPDGIYTIEGTSGKSYPMRVFDIEGEEGLSCIEIERPAAGDTIQFQLDGLYPCPGTGGGTADVWGRF